MRIIVLCGLALAGLGCSGTTEEAKKPVSDSDITATKPVQSWPKMAIFKNDKGAVVCPVMKDEIADPGHAVGFQDYKGTRYYFCCEMCPTQFKANPEKYLAKK